MSKNSIKNKSLSLTENFNKYFSVDLATTDEQKLNLFKIRYRVYCEEFGYFSPSSGVAHQLPDKTERDEFDARSLHCLVTHKSSGIPAGCVRVVTTQSSMYDDPLPMEKHCSDSLSLEALELLGRNRSSIGELSRLAVDPMFRRRRGEQCDQVGKIGAPDFSLQERRAFPLIAVAGLMAAAAISELMEKNTIFAMMDPALPRLLRRSGFHFTRVGEEIDYYGRRAPYYITVQSYLENIPSELNNFYYDIYHHFDTKHRDIIGGFATNYRYGKTL